MRGLSVVVPAYNEEPAIGDVLAGLLAVMNRAGMLYEVIVVDDGSQDATAEVAGRCQGVTVLRHRENRGYGAALKTGIRHARHDLVCITDADGTYPNERIPDLVARLGEGDFGMVVGARVGENVHIPLVRRPAKWVIGRLAGFVAGEAIPDLNSGLRVFQRGAALRLLGLLPEKFSFTTTITLAMLRRIGETCQRRVQASGLKDFRWVHILDYQLPFDDAEFDVWFCLESVGHVSEPGRLVAELGRLTRAGRTLALSTPNVLWEPVHALVASTGLRHSEGPHRFVRYRRLMTMVERVGFEVVRTETNVLIPEGSGWALGLGLWLERQLPRRFMDWVGLRRLLVCRRLGQEGRYGS